MPWTSKAATVILQGAVAARHKEIGGKVVDARIARGWSQEDLAYHAQVSVGTISRLENGKHAARGNTILKVAGALDLAVSELRPPGDGDYFPLMPDTEQLDRIEAKVDELLNRLPAGEPAPAAPKRPPRPHPRAPQRPTRATG